MLVLPDLASLAYKDDICFFLSICKWPKSRRKKNGGKVVVVLCLRCGRPEAGSPAAVWAAGVPPSTPRGQAHAAGTEYH
jgi:hypothetical protein